MIGVALVLFALFNRRPQARPTAPETKTLQPREELVVSSGTIGPGGSLARSLAGAEVPPVDIDRIQRTLRPLFDPRHARQEDVFEVYRTTAGAFAKLQYWPNRLEYYTVERSSAGVLSAAQARVPTTHSLSRAAGQIRDSLWESMIADGIPPQIADQFTALFRWRIDFLTEPRNGDAYKVIWTQETGNGVTRHGQVLYAYYNGEETDELYAFPVAGEYYDQTGESLRGEFLRAPLTAPRISSGFTNRRFHPILRYWRPHHGIDYGAPSGTPAIAIGSGVVIAKGYNGGLGNELRIRHSGSYVSIYGHLRGYPRGIHVGSHVHQGQVVGYVGSTGLSTGPHLHFGFEDNGKLVNFLNYRSKHRSPKVPAAQKARFEEVKRDGMAELAAVTPAAPASLR